MLATKTSLLEESIKKWENYLILGELPSIPPGVSNCPLCISYYVSGGYCDGCPVSNAGFPSCEDTPYEDAYTAWEQEEYDSWIIEVDREIKFLESLRRIK